jgi:anti-anti-sigma factor
VERPYRHIAVERQGEVFCVRLPRQHLDESAVYELGDELLSLVADQGCRKLALQLGPEPVQCLYSVFLARLVSLRRRLLEHDGALRLYDVPPETLDVFDAARLKDYFDFAADRDAAVAALTA